MVLDQLQIEGLDQVLLEPASAFAPRRGVSRHRFRGLCLRSKGAPASLSLRSHSPGRLAMRGFATEGSAGYSDQCQLQLTPAEGGAVVPSS